jgi:hypothetical protein
MVTGRLTRAAPRVLFSLCLAACELVVGGPEQAIVRSRDGEVEDSGPLEAGTDAALLPDAVGREAGAPMPPPPPHDAGAPCVPLPPCLTTEQACAQGCSTQFGDCMFGPPGHGKTCQMELDDCKATCQSTCESCVACPAGASACELR